MIRLSFVLSAMLLTSNAFAEGGAMGGGSITSILPMIILLVAFMYFMVIRPQSKKAKEHKSLMESLKKGDEIVTIGGLLGKIESITDDFLVVNLSGSNSVTIQRNAVANILPKGTMKGI